MKPLILQIPVSHFLKFTDHSLMPKRKPTIVMISFNLVTMILSVEAKMFTDWVKGEMWTKFNTGFVTFSQRGNLVEN